MSASVSLNDVLVRLLGPVFDLVGGAYERPYLSPDAVQSALEIIGTTFKLILQEREPHGQCKDGPLRSANLDP